MIDLRFRNISYEDMQLLRYWRNLSHVRGGMAIQDLITIEGQRRWLETLELTTSKHFIYSLGENDIGSGNITRIDTSSGSFETGIYCGNDNFIKHWINICALLYIYDTAFYSLNLSRATAIILDNNYPALSLNKSIGFRYAGKSAEGISRYTLEKEDYFPRRTKIGSYLAGQGIFIKSEINQTPDVIARKTDD
jgi:RimJ/RimL family protein N-acetyltransferase